MSVMIQRLAGAGLAVMILVGIVTPVWAQTPTPNQINAIAKELWCPLCNGVRLDNCELQACIQMKEVIAEKLMAGESRDQIRAYFVQQYGDVVLGAPSNEGFNRVVWLMPVLVGLVAAGWLVFLVRSWTKRRLPTAAAVAAATATPAAVVDATTAATSKDAYLKRVDEEFKQYE